MPALESSGREKEGIFCELGLRLFFPIETSLPDALNRPSQRK
jgi:hypothetical protein